MSKIVTVIDPKRFNGNEKVLKLIDVVTSILAHDGYSIRSGKYNGIQKPFNEKFSEAVRSLKEDEFKRLFIYEECPKNNQLIGSTRHYNLLYNESEEIERYQKRVVTDKKGFDILLESIIGKNYKFLMEIYKEKYRLFLAQMIGTELNNKVCPEFVITYNLLKQDNIRSYDLINGTNAIFYDIMHSLKIDSYDIRDI